MQHLEQLRGTPVRGMSFQRKYRLSDTSLVQIGLGLTDPRPRLVGLKQNHRLKRLAGQLRMAKPSQDHRSIVQGGRLPPGNSQGSPRE